MKDSKFLRFLDRGVGALLCFALTLLVRAKRTRRPPDFPIKKILVIELFEMGAAVMIAPSLSYLLKTIPGVELHALTGESTQPVWKILGLIPEQNVHVIGGNGLFSFVSSSLKKLLTLRRVSPDLIIDYNLFLRYTALISGAIPARSRAGFYKYELEGLYRGNIYDTKCYFNQNEHISKNFLALTKAALKPQQDSPGLKESISTEELKIPSFSSNSKARLAIEQKLRNLCPDQKYSLLVVSPDVGPTLAVRNYPAASFASAITEVLVSDRQLLTVIVGTERDRGTADTVVRLVNSDRCVSLCGQTNFSELLELLAMANLVVCNDNGIGHFSALTQTKAVALFSTDSPYVYGPLGDCTIIYSFYHCSPCILAYNHKKTRCQDNLCLQSIPSSTLATYITKGLKGQLRGRTINNEASYL